MFSLPYIDFCWDLFFTLIIFVFSQVHYFVVLATLYPPLYDFHSDEIGPGLMEPLTSLYAHFRSFPVTTRSLLHCCTLATGRSIFQQGVLMSSDQSEKSPRSSLDFALARDDAPPVSFFSAPSENEGGLRTAHLPKDNICFRLFLSQMHVLAHKQSRPSTRMFYLPLEGRWMCPEEKRLMQNRESCTCSVVSTLGWDIV